MSSGAQGKLFFFQENNLGHLPGKSFSLLFRWVCRIKDQTVINNVECAMNQLAPGDWLPKKQKKCKQFGQMKNTLEKSLL